LATLISIIIWFLLLFGAQFLGFIYCNKILTNRASYYCSKTLGLLLITFISWILGVVFSLTVINSILLTVILLFISYYLVIKQQDTKEIFFNWKEFFYSESLFIGSFLFVWIIYSFHPEIYWGEKPMDFTFLNYFTRLNTFEISDPWASGNKLGYYYLGTYLISSLTKLSGLQTSVAYGVALATVFALLVSTITALALSLSVSRLTAYVIGFIYILVGNFDGLFLWFTKKYPVGFDLYWATSRTLTSPGMNEYPLWSMLFADVHAHIIALPFVALTLLLIIQLTKNAFNSDNKTFLSILLGVSWGSLASINTWDFINITLSMVVLFILLAAYNYLYDKKNILNLFKIFSTTIIVSAICVIPFKLIISAESQINWGFVYPEEFNNLLQIFKVFGHWILIIITSFVLYTYSQNDSYSFKEKSIRKLIIFSLLSFLPIILGVITTKFCNVPNAPWQILSIASLICSIGSYLFIYTEQEYELELTQIVGFLLLAAGIHLSVSESFFLMDRMNTTFKTYHYIWALLGISSLLLICFWIKKSQNNFFSKKLGFVSLVIFLIPTIISSSLCIYIMTTFKRIPSDRPTIDGTHYLTKFNPEEISAINWLNNNIKDTPTIVEAFGPSYQEYSRISMHTGLPIVLGWEYHVQQRGSKDTTQRKDAIEKIYTSNSINERMRELNKYDVQLIVVGKLEREKYGLNVDEFFLRNPGYFTEVFSNNLIGKSSVRIFKHKYTSIKDL
jgi:YYY domain-containing protein